MPSLSPKRRSKDIASFVIQAATYTDGTWGVTGSPVSITGNLKGDQSAFERDMEEVSSDCTDWKHNVQVAKGARTSITVTKCSNWHDLATIMEGEFAKITKTGISFAGSGLYYSVENLEEGGQGKGAEMPVLHFGPADNGD